MTVGRENEGRLEEGEECMQRENKRNGEKFITI